MEYKIPTFNSFEKFSEEVFPSSKYCLLPLYVILYLNNLNVNSITKPGFKLATEQLFPGKNAFCMEISFTKEKDKKQLWTESEI